MCSSIFYYPNKLINETKCIEFCVRNEIKKFGESTVSRTQVQLWYNQFREGREDVNDDTRTR